MGRKPVGDAVAVRLPADLARWLEALAREWGCTRSEAVRRILRLHRSQPPAGGA